MIDELLVIWEETYKKGQLTFWLFLALKHGEKYVEEIQNFIQEFSEKTISYDEQSLYRSLRKFQHLEIVEYLLENGYYNNNNNDYINNNNYYYNHYYYYQERQEICGESTH